MRPPYMLMSKPLPMPRHRAATAAGWFRVCSSLGQIRFSESFSVSDFEEVGIPFGSDLAKEMASCEALAQVGLILGLSALASCCKLPLSLLSLCDNTGAESELNKMFPRSTYPINPTRNLSFFLADWNLQSEERGKSGECHGHKAKGLNMLSSTRRRPMLSEENQCV